MTPTSLALGTLAALAVATAGCTRADVRPSGSRLAIEVAPLDLPGIGNARYAIEVRNALDAVVWSQVVDSDQYGDGTGSIAYVGTCDASGNPHRVTLAIDQLWDDQGTPLSSPGDYVDPGPITQPGITCVENADVPVEFDLTLARPARQGFFDVAVSFDDVFCSAKVDCQAALLHDGDRRGPTVLMTFACTAGHGASGPEPTWMYLSDVTLSCVDADDSGDLPPIAQTIAIGSATHPGRQGGSGLLFDWAVYEDEEGFEDIDKCFWNHAFGLDLAAIGARRCTLHATGTASGHELVGGMIGLGDVWPVIAFDVEVVDAQGALCSNHPLDGQPTGVRTTYVTPDTAPRPERFAASYLCGDVPEPLAGAVCVGAGTTLAAFSPTTVGAQPAVDVDIGGVRAKTPYLLPPGATLASDCCLAPCCGAR